MYKIISTVLIIGSLTTMLEATSYSFIEDQSEASAGNRYTLEVVSQQVDSQDAQSNGLRWNARVIGLDDKNRVEGILGESTDPNRSKDTLLFVIFRGVNLEVRLGAKVVLYQKNFKNCQELQIGQKVYCRGIEWVHSPQSPGVISVSYVGHGLSTECRSVPE